MIVGRGVGDKRQVTSASPGERVFRLSSHGAVGSAERDQRPLFASKTVS